MKKIFIFRILNIFVIVLLLISCKRNYEKTLEKYLNYIKRSDYKKAYNLLSSKDKNVVSYENFSNEDKKTPILRNISKRIIYKITDSSISETGAVVKINVTVKKIDLKKAYYLIPELLNENLPVNDIDGIFRKNKKTLKACYVSSNVEYKLIKENNEWKIDADFERKRNVSILLNEAGKYLKDNDYRSALVKYEEVLDFDESNINALDNLMLIKEKMNYIDNFLEIKHGILEKNEKGAKISLSVVNNGTIVVKSIFVNFLFYDSSGNLIFKKNKDILSSINKKLGYDENIAVIIKFNNMNNFYKVDCIISSIDF